MGRAKGSWEAWAAVCGVEKREAGPRPVPRGFPLFPFYFPNPFSKRVLGKTIKDKKQKQQITKILCPSMNAKHVYFPQKLLIF